MRIQLLVLALMTILSVQSHAFLTLNESGELTPKGMFKLGIEPQVRLSEGSGANIGAYIDSAINEEFSWRAHLGTGDTDFWGGASIKWVPFPDYQDQPAIGIRIEADLGRDDHQNLVAVRAIPLISKAFDTEVGRLTPYAGLPLGVLAYGGDSNSMSQLIIGSEGRFEQARNFVFSAELGFNLSRTFSYLAGSAAFLF